MQQSTPIKAVSVLASLLVLGLIVCAAVRVVTSDGPCTPKQPAPTGGP